MIGVSIGFLIVSESKATMHDIDDLVMDGVTPRGIMGPISYKSLPYPLVIGLTDEMNLGKPIPTNYQWLLRTQINAVIESVQHACDLEYPRDALQHITTTLHQSTGLEITDAWCLTDMISIRAGSDTLVASKLPIIRLLARYHAGWDTQVRNAMRTLPQQSVYSDVDPSSDFSQYVYYAEYYGLLERVDGDKLQMFEVISDEELEMLVGHADREVSDMPTLEQVMKLWIEQHANIQVITLLWWKNWKLIQWLIQRFEWQTAEQQQETIYTMLDAIQSNPDPVVEPLRAWLIRR